MNIDLGLISLRVSRTPSAKAYASFAAALADCNGYDDSEILNVVEAKTRALRDRPAPPSENELHAMLGILTAGKSTVRVLDFGGACGAHYFNVRAALRNVELHWVIVETKGMAERARRLGVQAAPSIEAALELLRPDVLFTSGAIQYTPEPYRALDSLLAVRAPVFVWSRGLVSATDIVCVQRSHLSSNGPGPLPPGFADRSINFPCTSVRRSEVLARLRAAYTHLVELPVQPQSHPHGSSNFSALCY